MADVEQRDALDVVDQRARAHDLEQARHDVDLDAAVGAGAHDAQEVVVAGAREGDDDAVDLLPGDDRVQVVERADDRLTSAPPWPLRRGSPSSRNPTSSMRYSGCAAILAASVWPTSPAPMISTRSLNERRDQTVTLPIQRADGTSTTARAQNTISIATGASSPMASTRTMRSSQLAEVSAVRPFSDSPRLKPPMLRPGSRYRPKAQRAASQYGVRRTRSSASGARLALERPVQLSPSSGRWCNSSASQTASIDGDHERHDVRDQRRGDAQRRRPARPRAA